MRCMECGKTPQMKHTVNEFYTTDSLTKPARVVTVYGGIETDTCLKCGAVYQTYPCLGPLIDLLAEGHSVAYWNERERRWTTKVF